MGEKKIARLNTRHDLHVLSIRKRLADPDGISAKAVIDGLIKANILVDDSAKYVRSVTFSQEKGGQEKTILTFTEVEAKKNKP